MSIKVMGLDKNESFLGTDTNLGIRKQQNVMAQMMYDEMSKKTSSVNKVITAVAISPTTSHRKTFKTFWK